MTSRLEGKTAVITGGTSGIGEATAERFVGEGARVVLAGRSEEKGAALAKRLGDSALYCRCDVTVESDLAGAIGLALERWGKLDILFKGIGHTSCLLAQRPNEQEGDWQRLRQYVLRWWRWHLGGLDGMVRWKGGAQRTWHHVRTHLRLKHPPG